jgi:SpoVK/Ycf46/Vps4 family AAA+-type ATPase
MTASALAGEIKFPMFTVLLHGLITKYFGETASKLRTIFDAVRTTRGVYLFDEIDALAGSRTRGDDVGEARRVLNSFLQFLEEDPGPSIIVATTNVPELLDSAILRRFDVVLRYELPDAKAIEQTVRRRLNGFQTARIAWKQVADVANGLSTADLVRGTEDAARRAVLAGLETITTSVLLDALERRRTLQLIGDTNGSARQTSHSGADRGGGSKLSTGPRSRRSPAK